MSLIHWDKSVLSFHLREIVEDGHHNSNPVALAGLGAIAVTFLFLPAVTKLGKPFLKAAIKNSFFLDEENTALSVNNNSSELTKIWQQAAIASQNNDIKTGSKQLNNQLS